MSHDNIGCLADPSPQSLVTFCILKLVLECFSSPSGTQLPMSILPLPWYYISFSYILNLCNFPMFSFTLFYGYPFHKFVRNSFIIIFSFVEHVHVDIATLLVFGLCYLYQTILCYFCYSFDPYFIRSRNSIWFFLKMHSVMNNVHFCSCWFPRSLLCLALFLITVKYERHLSEAFSPNKE